MGQFALKEHTGTSDTFLHNTNQFDTLLTLFEMYPTQLTFYCALLTSHLNKVWY